MEQSNYSLTFILVVILALSTVSNFVGSIPILWGLDNIQLYSMYYPIIIIINIIISPVLVFVLFYLIGKKFDLKSNLKFSIIRLLIGAYVGHFLSFNIVRFFGEYYNFWSTIVSSIVSLAFLGTFFTAFTGLAIAYLKQNN